MICDGNGRNGLFPEFGRSKNQKTGDRGAQTYKYTNVKLYKYTNAQIDNWTNTPSQKYTNIQIYK